MGGVACDVSTHNGDDVVVSAFRLPRVCGAARCGAVRCQVLALISGPVLPCFARALSRRELLRARLGWFGASWALMCAADVLPSPVPS